MHQEKSGNPDWKWRKCERHVAAGDGGQTTIDHQARLITKK
jgi:hypothetical protein